MRNSWFILRTLRWRRGAAAALGTLVALAAAACGGSASSAGPIVVGSLLDATGPLNIYGTDMVAATKLAINDINAHGGLLGRKLRLISFDTQSDQSKYTQYATELAVRYHPAVVMGGITSASREAIRPILDRYHVLYFYNEQYEGGVCDKNTFLTGVVPSQQLAALIPWTVKHVGAKLYVAAADYNYGHISATWVQRYAAQNGGKVVKTTFVPLDSSDFGSIISDIEATKPNTVVSLLVGGNHISFYRAFASAGLENSIKIVSPTFGLGNEQVVLAPSESKDITVAYPYFEELDNPTNKAFVALWRQHYGNTYPYITDSAVTVWNGWHLWAEAVKKAGSIDRDKVIKALESGISFQSPSGVVTMNGRSHHVTQNVSIAVTNSHHGFTVISTQHNVPPSYENSVCNLIASPNTNKQFTP